MTVIKKTLEDCKLRFANDPLPFRGIPEMTRKKSQTVFVKTLKDVVIPAGTEGTLEPWRRSDIIDYVSVMVSHNKDVTSEWLIPRKDAISLGIIAETEKPEEPGEWSR